MLIYADRFRIESAKKLRSLPEYQELNKEERRSLRLTAFSQKESFRWIGWERIAPCICAVKQALVFLGLMFIMKIVFGLRVDFTAWHKYLILLLFVMVFGPISAQELRGNYLQHRILKTKMNFKGKTATLNWPRWFRRSRRS